MDDLKKKEQAKDKTPAQSPSIKDVAPASKSAVPGAENPTPQASVLPEAAIADKANPVTAAKLSLPDAKDIIPSSKNAASEAGKEAPVIDAQQVKDIVSVPQNPKEVPKRDSEANWSFSTVGQNVQDTANADNADLLELSRQLGTPTRR